MPKNSMTPDEFRRAAEAYHADLEPVDTRHVRLLGGALGLIHAKVEELGSLCQATLDVAPEAKASVLLQLRDLVLLVATDGSTPQ